MSGAGDNRFQPVPFELPPEVVTPGQLYVLMQSLNTKMSLQLIHQQTLEAQIKALDGDTKQMREAWQTAGSLLRFVKYAAGLGTALLVTYAMFKGLGEAIKNWLLS